MVYSKCCNGSKASSFPFIMQIKIRLIIAIIILAGCEKKESAVDPSPLASYFTDTSLPAAIMGYTTREGPTFWYAFGPSVLGKRDTVTKDHIFRITSMTKAISCVAALQLVERGLIGLDEPLNELMPEMISIPILTADGELVKSDQVITLKHLLTHTSGFADKSMSSRLAHFKPATWEYSDNPRLFEPGETTMAQVLSGWVR